jgi:glycosyltransferase involved in cell wall biosynthesis
MRCCARLWPNYLQPDDPAPMAEYDAWIRAKLEQVDMLTTPSQNTKDEYRAWGIDRDIRVVEPGLDHHRFHRRQQRAGDTFRVACIGTVIPSKGAHVAMAAVQMLDPTRFSLDIRGDEPGWHADRDYGKRLRAAHRGTHRISFHGRYDNQALPGLLTQADVLVVPSLWHETYCLTIREGFLAGVPVIASRLGAMAEGIRDGETGLLFAPGDAADLAAKIQRLHDDRALYERLATSRKQVPTTEQMTDALLDVYAEAIS